MTMLRLHWEGGREEQLHLNRGGRVELGGKGLKLAWVGSEEWGVGSGEWGVGSEE